MKLSSGNPNTERANSRFFSVLSKRRCFQWTWTPPLSLCPQPHSETLFHINKKLLKKKLASAEDCEVGLDAVLCGVVSQEALLVDFGHLEQILAVPTIHASAQERPLEDPNAPSCP